MTKGNVLIIEDTDLVRNTLRARLEKEGYEVAIASTVPSALQALRTRMPELIILDLTLFDTEDPVSGLSDGFAVLGLLRVNYPYANPGVVIYTVSTSPQIESRAKSMRALAVVEKSSGIEALLNALRLAMEQRNALPGSPTQPAIA